MLNERENPDEQASDDDDLPGRQSDGSGPPPEGTNGEYDGDSYPDSIRHYRERQTGRFTRPPRLAS